MAAVASGGIRKIIGRSYSRGEAEIFVCSKPNTCHFTVLFLEYASEYATQREQFQKKLSSFGQIQVCRKKQLITLALDAHVLHLFGCYHDIFYFPLSCMKLVET